MANLLRQLFVRTRSRYRAITFVLLFVLILGIAYQRDWPLTTPKNRYRYLQDFASPEYGVQAFLFWKGEEDVQQELQLVKNMGFGWVKQSLAWRDIEPFKDSPLDWWKADRVVEWVEEAGLKLLVRLDRQPFWAQADPKRPLENSPPVDFSDFGAFCGAVAERYKGRIAAYQVWNEPNLAREWGERSPNPSEYVELLKVCFLAIKAADPEAIVISAGLAPTGVHPPTAIPDMEFLEAMYDAGAANYFDVLGVHAPGFKAPPEVAPEVGEQEVYGGYRGNVFRHVEDMRQIMVVNGDSDKQIAILEMGWMLEQNIHKDYAWYGVTQAQQADYLVRAYQYAREHWQPWIGLMITIYFAHPEWEPANNEEWWWAIVLPDGTARPAYYALSAMDK